MCRGISDCKNGYRPRTNIVKIRRVIVTNYHSILARWRKHFSQLLSVHGVNDVGQTKIHTAERMVPEVSALEDEMAIENLKRHKSPGIDQIPVELIKSGRRTIRYENHKILIRFEIRRNYLANGRGRSLYPCIGRVIKSIVLIIETYHFFQICTNFTQHHSVQVNSICRKLLWIISVDFDTTYQLLISYSAFVKYLKKYANKMNQCFSYL